MKKILFTVLLLCSVLNVYAQTLSSTENGTNNLNELIERWQSIDGDSKSILQDFSTAELTQLRSYLSFQNSMNVNLGAPEFNFDPTQITNAYGYEAFVPGIVKFNIASPSLLTVIGSGDALEIAGAINPFDSTEAYTIRFDGTVYSFDITTAEYTYLGTLNNLFMEDIAFNPIDNKLYGISEAGSLYLIDPLAVTATYIGDMGGSGLPLGFAIDGLGNAYFYDTHDVMYTVDLTTGAATPYGYIGFDAHYIQSMSWDPESNTVYMAAFNAGTLMSELRSVDLATGMSTFIGNIGTSVAEMFWVSFVTEDAPIVAGNCDLEGDTSIGLTWDRPLPDGSDISTAGVDTKYRVYGPFTVTETGSYTIDSEQSGWDGLIFLYQNQFDVNNPLNNFVDGNDDYQGLGTSQIISTLEVGTEYFLVTTGFSTSDFGYFLNQFTGPGQVNCEYEEVQTCNWTVTVTGESYGHFISWSLKHGDIVLVSGGQYITNGFYDQKQINYQGPVDFEIIAGEDTLAGFASYTISNGTQIVAMGQIIPGEQISHTNLLCSSVSSGCLEAPNGQFPANAFTPECTGESEIISSEAKTGQYSLVNLQLEKDYTFSSSVDTDFITISNEDGTEIYATGTGSLNFISPSNQTVRFYLHLNEECEFDETTRSKSVQCNGILGGPDNDDCDNAIEVNCGDVISSSTYFATNTTGNEAPDVFYKFTGNGVPQHINLDLCDANYDTYVSVFSDCSFTNEVAFNNNACSLQSNLTFFSDGVSTYYIMVEGSNSNKGSFNMTVSCEDDTYDPCALELEGMFMNGLSISTQEEVKMVANDFDVLANTQMELEKITVQLYDRQELPTSYDLKFFEGQNSVGNQFGESIANLTPTSIQEIGYFPTLNAPIYEVEFTLPTTVIFPANGNTDKRYWVGISANDTPDSQYVSWGTYVKFSPYGLGAWITADGGNTWQEYLYGPQSLELFMKLDGECATLGMDDLSNVDFAYYPNPTKNILHLETSKAVQSYEVFNLAGQKVLNNKKIMQKQIDLSSLSQGTYVVRVTLDENQIETFKVLKK